MVEFALRPASGRSRGSLRQATSTSRVLGAVSAAPARPRTAVPAAASFDDYRAAAFDWISCKISSAFGVRPIVVTRKAALFAGGEGSRETWAIATTLIRTAILNGVNPQAWLTDVLERMVRGEVRSTELAILLPWAWRRPDTAAAA